MIEKEYFVKFRCIAPGPSPREGGRSTTIKVNATNKEEAKEKAKPIIQEACKTENPTEYMIISVHTRQELILMGKPIPGEPPQTIIS